MVWQVDMKLIVDRNAMLRNIERAELLSKRRVALMFKDYYADFFDDAKFNGYTCFGHNTDCATQVSYNIFDQSIRAAKVCTPETPNVLYCNTAYVPINTGDCREGMNLEGARLFINFLREEGVENIYGLVTNGCVNDLFVTRGVLEEIHLTTGVRISIGGSFVLDKIEELPDSVEELRIGEYMLFGTIPFSNHYEIFGENSLLLELEVGAVYPERRHVLVKGGSVLFDAEMSTLITGGLGFVHQYSDYTIYRDFNMTFRKGDKIFVIPNYNSLKLLKDVERKYI